MFFNKQREKTGTYDGAVVFVEGSHYPVKHGHADMKQRVLWRDGAYHWAKATDPTHAHLYERNVVELPIYGEGEG